jgi:HAMP domain-containing protein
MVSISVDKDIQSIRWYLIITSAITVAIVIAFLRALTNKIILNPITHLVDVVNKISMGEIDKKIEITSNDEIKDLADAIDRLRTSMKMAIEKLYKR